MEPLERLLVAKRGEAMLLGSLGLTGRTGEDDPIAAAAGLLKVNAKALRSVVAKEEKTKEQKKPKPRKPATRKRVKP